MDYRHYDPEKDREAAHRIYREVGWMREGDGSAEATDRFHEAGPNWVALVNGEPECLVSNHPGTIRHLDADLPLCVVGAVLTSRIARQQKLASRLTAEAIAEDRLERGALVATLGIFDQGFYDRLGFGTGSTILTVHFDPKDLLVPVPSRVPVRLGKDDWKEIHAARLARRPAHGRVNITDPELTQGECLLGKEAFGLGFRDPDSGELTHHLWCTPKNVGQGPYFVRWTAWRTREELHDLLGLLRSFGDQVLKAEMREPWGIQFQDLLRKPFRRRGISTKSPFATRGDHLAYWQIRMNDVPDCLAQTRLPGTSSVEFHLTLTDPIVDHLSEDTRARWPGAGGEFVVTFGPQCAAEPGPPREGLPALRTSVNTFTRLWFGVRSPAGLALTAPDLDADPGLIEALGDVLRLPAPLPDWDY
jgi:hypothetical protein